MDAYSSFNLIMRWLHILAGITWIGHLYFFNFVNIPVQGSIDDATKKLINPQLMPRALWWFRWGAMITFISGLILFFTLYMQYDPTWGNAVLRDPTTGALSTRAKWIMMGMTLGTIMWFNVWMIIWPAQKKLLGGTAGDQAPALRKRATLASRTNTFLSGPMLFGMVNGSHAYVSGMASVITAIVIGLATIWLAINSSYKVGKTV